MSAKIFQFPQAQDFSQPLNPQGEDVILLICDRNSDQEKHRILIKGFRLVLWQHATENFVEHWYASLAYEQDGKIVMMREYLDAFQRAADVQSGIHYFRLRRPFDKILNAALLAGGYPTFDERLQYVDAATRQPIAVRFDRMQVILTPSST